jgi:hypothetical protein
MVPLRAESLISLPLSPEYPIANEDSGKRKKTLEFQDPPDPDISATLQDPHNHGAKDQHHYIQNPNPISKQSQSALESPGKSHGTSFSGTLHEFP